jgi:hypothetical protein
MRDYLRKKAKKSKKPTLNNESPDLMGALRSTHPTFAYHE